MSGNEDILCNLIEYPNLDILHKIYYSNLMSSGPDAIEFIRKKGKTSRPHLAQYILRNVQQSTDDGTCLQVRQAELRSTMPSTKIGDLPTNNPSYLTKANRYVYTIIDRGLSTIFDGISKADIINRNDIFWDNLKSHTPGEAIFVADPKGTAEDDSVLLIVVLDGFKETSYILYLDAKTMRELGRAECGWPIGLGFHGQHVG